MVRTLSALAVAAILGTVAASCTGASSVGGSQNSGAGTVARHFVEALISNPTSAGSYWRPDELSNFQGQVEAYQSYGRNFEACHVKDVLVPAAPEPGYAHLVVSVTFAQRCGFRGMSDGHGGDAGYTGCNVGIIYLNAKPYADYMSC